MSKIEKLWLEAEGFFRLGRDDLAQDCLAKVDQLVAERKAAKRSSKAAKKAEIKARLESVDPARFTAIAEIRRDFPEWKGQTVDRAAYVVMAGVPWGRIKVMLRGLQLPEEFICQMYGGVRSDEVMKRSQASEPIAESPQLALFHPEAFQGEENNLHIEVKRIRLEQANAKL
jgi:hypothetical protein